MNNAKTNDGTMCKCKCSCDKNNNMHYKRFHKLILSGENCPIFDGPHPETDPPSYRYFMITDSGYAFVKCTNKNCARKISPENGIIISDHDFA
jgi:hypothetical protein